MAADGFDDPILVLAPTGRDGSVITAMLTDAGLPSALVERLDDPGSILDGGAGLIVAQEAMDTGNAGALHRWLDAQPAWSDFPIVYLRNRSAPMTVAAQVGVERLGNVTILERPLHPTTLLSAARSAVRARRRQREAEALIRERARAEEQVRAAADLLERRVDERTSELAAANRQLVAEMMEREKVEATVLRMQRLEAVGQLTAGVAHDFNNLLTVVMGNLSRLERSADAEDKRRIEMMRLATERGAKLTSQLLAFSRRQKLEPKPVNMNEAVESLSELLQSTLGGGRRLETRLARNIWPALVDPTQIEMIILNLVINARDATDVGGAILVRTANARLRRAGARPEEPGPGDYVVLSVSDDGSGMDADTLARVFEPFFTTKGVGKGSGLGLSQVLGFAKQSGGGVRIQTAPGKGATVIVYFPRAEAPAIRGASLILESLEASSPGGTILLVDDDSAVRETTADMLRDLGFRVIEAGSGGAALEILDRGGRVDLLLLDFAMPGMNGADVARAAAAKRPGLRTLFVTGYAELAAIAQFDEQQVIRKPFEAGDLARRLARALQKDEETPPITGGG